MAQPSPGRKKPKSAADFVDMVVVGGAGHVGLPLALSFAHAGQRVQIFDINETVLETIGSGVMPFEEEGGEALLKEALGNGRLSMVSSLDDVAPTKTYIITIGTPVDEFLNPVHKAVFQCIDELLARFSDEHLLVLRSTVYPGTTDRLVQHIARVGKSPMLTFCPERVVQGECIRELAELPQIISGTTPAAVAAAAALFGQVAPEVFVMEPLEAEFAKLYDNTYRYIQFAIANELYMIAESAGADFYKIREGMTYKYSRAENMPRAGFAAGPCLVKDTMQLAAFSRNQFNLGVAAMGVNEGLVLYIIKQMRESHTLSDMTVGLLGMAFKADSDDTRSSLSYKMKNSLTLYAKKVITTDPNVRDDDALLNLEQVLDESDILVLCTPHAEYRNLDTRGKPVIDVWNFIKA